MGSATRLHVVLVEPEIPANTGNIGRTCVAVGCRLHLVRPLGFSLEDRYLRRAGLDYWPHLDLRVHPDWETCRRVLAPARLWLFAAAGLLRHTAVPYAPGDALVFGRESAGLPEHVLAGMRAQTVRIPMRPGYRSLNVGNAVAVAVYEAMRQMGLPGLT